MAVNRVVDYITITNGGIENPWEYSTAMITSYGFTAIDFHNYMQLFHARTPVFDNYLGLQSAIYFAFKKNKPYWDSVYKVQQDLEDYNPNTGFTETEKITHSGVDSTTNSGNATDSKNTYDNATMRPTGSSTNSGSGSVTYGHVIDTTKNRFWENPLDSMEKYREMSNFSLFESIINTVLQAISCRVYIPSTPPNQSNN